MAGKTVNQNKNNLRKKEKKKIVAGKTLNKNKTSGKGQEVTGQTRCQSLSTTIYTRSINSHSAPVKVTSKEAVTSYSTLKSICVQP